MSQKIRVERTYRATLQEVWDLWTTKEGFESWWGPVGFRVQVHTLEARVGGALRYDMMAATPEMIALMKEQGQPVSTETCGTFTELRPLERLVRVDLEPMHDAAHSAMQHEGFESQLTKLDERYQER